MANTPNHGYNVPDKGDDDWHNPLNENFEDYDTDIELRDQESNLSNYDPKAGAKFLATDTEAVYIGDGSNWQRLATSGPAPSFEQLNPSNNFLGVARSQPITPFEYFGVDATVKSGEFGGMYVNTASSSAKPFYGYATGGDVGAYHHYEGGTGKWKLTNDSVRLTVQSDGNVGIGTTAPATKLYVKDSISGRANTENHVAAIENTSSQGGADVLSVKINEDPSDLGNANNFITFKDADDNGIGAIEGDGNGGVTTASAGNDYAEWLPRRDPDDTIEAGDVVGIHAGTVSHTTAGADRAMAVSTQPIVTGNDPGPAVEDRQRHEKIAFIGQAPVKVHGPVETGDLILPSGEGDGTARAIAPAAYRPGNGPIVGRAWEGTTDEGVTKVTVAVGIDPGDALAATVEKQADRIEALEADRDRRAARIEELNAESDQKDARIEALESGQEQKDARIDELEERLRAVEQAAGVTPGSGPTTADD